MVNVSIHEDLVSVVEFEPFYREFIKYKEESDFAEHPAPTRKVQEDYEGVSKLFGRDRFDKKSAQASGEDVQHLHVRQEDSLWEDENGNLLAQWKCTSDSYIIYSYFKYAEAHYYYVITFLADKGHVFYEKNVVHYIQVAKSYRLKIQGLTT